MTPHNNFCEVSSALAFYRSENQDLERLSAWPQLIHVVKNGAGIQTRTCLIPRPSFQPPGLVPRGGVLTSSVSRFWKGSCKHFSSQPLCKHLGLVLERAKKGKVVDEVGGRDIWLLTPASWAPVL